MEGPVQRKRVESKQLAIGYGIGFVRSYVRKGVFLVGIGCANYKGCESSGKKDCMVADFGDLKWLESTTKDTSGNWLYCWAVDEKYFKDHGEHRRGTKIYCQACYHYMEASKKP